MNRHRIIWGGFIVAMLAGPAYTFYSVATSTEPENAAAPASRIIIPPDESAPRQPVAEGAAEVCQGQEYGAGNGWRGCSYVEVYTDRMSYAPGDTIFLHVSTTSLTYKFEVYRETWTKLRLERIPAIPGMFHAVPDKEPWLGANWPVSFAWRIPGDCETGSYFIKLTNNNDGTYTYRPFVVTPREPGYRSRVAFITNYNTRTAYNAWGGKSLYYSYVPGEDRTARVSFLRPFDDWSGKGGFFYGSYCALSELEDAGFAPEYWTEWDIEQDPDLLHDYDVVVTAEVNEYTTCTYYDALVLHHRRGAHIASFSACDIHWQARYENDGTIMASWKGSLDDPLWGTPGQTTRWAWEPLNRPPSVLIGTEFAQYSQQFLPEDLVVQDTPASEWVFAGTGLQPGDAFGHETASGETQVLTQYSPAVDTVASVTLQRPEYPGNPPPVDYVECHAVFYADNAEYGFPDGNGGQVFHAGSTMGWTLAMRSNQPDYEKVRQATRNVIQHMLGSPPPPDCNFNYWPDARDIAEGTSSDKWPPYGVPDECQFADDGTDALPPSGAERRIPPP
ncbi:MAG: hypothetical protein KKB50_11910 [Planctomycetes bacterium]|nr:hypothetical protein [Planctomycetota bacterium]